MRFDTGGAGKGLAADLIAGRLRGYSRFIVDCGGDIRIGGADALVRPYEVFVEHPLTGERAHVLRLGSGAVATSGLNVRIWRGADGRYAHHLLDPATGEPAWTGLIGVTALGDTAVEARRSPRRRCSPAPAAAADSRRARRPARPRQRPGRAGRPAQRSPAPRIRLPGRGPPRERRRQRPPDPRLVAGQPRLRPGRAGPGHDLGRPRPGDGRQGDAPPGLSRKLLAIHEHTALAGIVAIAVHGITLLGDPWLHPGVSGVAVPFAMGFRPLWTGLGIVAGYLAALLGLSFYVRRRIGARLWRKAHRATVVVYLLGLVHALGAGTDASTLWFRWWVLVTGVPIAALFAYRLGAGARAGRRKRPAPRPTGPVAANYERSLTIR